MCSIVEDDFGDEGGAHSMLNEPVPEETIELENEICKKCNENKAIIKLKLLKEAQCKNCFLNYVRHKFRATLGATKIVRKGADVLLIFNGRPENITMFDMVKFAMEQEAFKRLHFNAKALFVDESAINQGKNAESLEELLNYFKTFGFPSYYAALASSQQHCSIDDNEAIKKIQESSTAYLNILDNFKSTSSKQDFIAQTRNSLYKTVAKKLNCNYIFLSEIGVDLAKKLLSNVALGRGCSLASDIAFCDDRDPSTKIIRPLRDLNPNEIEEYVKINELKSFSNVNEHFRNVSSIQNLTSKFVDDLQTNFPATVSTIFRTGDKIGTNSSSNISSDDENNDEDLIKLFDKSMKVSSSSNCKFCKSKLDFQDSATLFAVEYSRLVSSKVNSNATSSEDIVLASRQIENDAKKAVDGVDDDVESIKRYLCHSCRNIFADLA